ncbi:N-acetyltransferase [Streptococcus pneumoniae]|nr:N-acetyltransferase [Streptococcus pneumoniae]CJB53599.1 acetyltransferase [Streptococcus pneumoniae]CKI72024.1 acetyltransferase [Streptococcus pneumoniae]
MISKTLLEIRLNSLIDLRMFYFILLYFRLENKESHKSQEIGNLLRVYNRSKREEAESEPLNLYVEDEKGNLLAGLIAETFGNWLEIEYLFVKEELRGQGIGSKLLQQAESEAKNRNCCFSFVNTYQFQALDFYQKHGYKEVFSLQDYLYIRQRYYYQKNL